MLEVMRPLATRRAALLSMLATPGRSLGSEPFPNRPLRWIVAYAAGGGSDALARVVGAGVAAELGQPVVIENRPGAATNLAAETAARAAPDGHTVFQADNGTLVFNPALFRRLPYDPALDFRPVGLMARYHLIVAVRADAPVPDIAAWLDRARREPGTVDCAIPGIGSPHHLALERLAGAAAAHINPVVYRGGAPALTDLLGGAVGAAVLELSGASAALRAGRIRALAVASARRPDSLPDVPTLAEAGFGGFAANAWTGLVVPSATPGPIVARLGVALTAALASAAVRDRLRSGGIDLLPGDAAAFQALLADERALWVPLIRARGIALDN